MAMTLFCFKSWTLPNIASVLPGFMGPFSTWPVASPSCCSRGSLLPSATLWPKKTHSARRLRQALCHCRASQQAGPCRPGVRPLSLSLLPLYWPKSKSNICLPLYVNSSKASCGPQWNLTFRFKKGSLKCVPIAHCIFLSHYPSRFTEIDSLVAYKIVILLYLAH